MGGEVSVPAWVPGRRILKSGLVLGIFLWFVAMGIGQGSTEGNPVRFRWAMVAIAAQGGEIRLIDKDTVLHTGDEIKMAVELESRCYVYVVWVDSAGRVHRLFPYTWEQFGRDYKVGASYYIPPGPPWFRLDAEEGIEKVYLVASSTRMDVLERHLRAYEDGPTQEKPALAEAVGTELKRLRKVAMKFSRPAERPVALAGSLRGDQDSETDSSKPDVATMATEIKAPSLYCRTFTIEHRE